MSTKIKFKKEVDFPGQRWYYNSITCVRGHPKRQVGEGEKNVKGLQAGRTLT